MKFYTNQNSLYIICFLASIITTVPLAISPLCESCNRSGIKKAIKISARLAFFFLFMISTCFTYKVSPSIFLTMTVYSTTFCGFFLQVVLHYKRTEISKTLHQLCRLSNALDPQVIIGSHYTLINLTVYISSIICTCTLLLLFFFYREWDSYRNIVVIHFSLIPEFQDLGLAFAYMSSTLSAVIGGAVCGISCLLCDSTYLTLSNIIKSYRKNLVNKMRTLNLSTFIFNDIKTLTNIASLVESVDQALSVCALLQYCILSSMIFISISMAIVDETIFKSVVIIGLNSGVFTIAVYMFCILTISGSVVHEESAKLKKVGLEFSGIFGGESVFLPYPRDGAVFALFLLLGNIRDVPLNVTAGGMFAIQKTIFLIMINAVVTYGVIMFQLKS